MKKYFTKYIPKEGIILLDNKLLAAKIRLEDGRLGRVKVLGTDCGVQMIELDEGGTVMSDDYDYNVVNLSLCSRDIQIGDKDITSWAKKNGHIISYNEGLEYVENYPSGRAHLKNEKSSGSYTLPLGHSVDDLHGFEHDTYKVIGVISEAALTFVVEGQEFDEEDINIRKLCRDTDANWQYSCMHCGSKRECRNDEGNEVFIKGPCNHFH